MLKCKIIKLRKLVDNTKLLIQISLNKLTYTIISIEKIKNYVLYEIDYDKIIKILNSKSTLLLNKISN